MIDITDKIFNGTTVVMDGCNFVRCIFRDCVFRWNGGEFGFKDVSFENFRGFISEDRRIADTVSILKALNLLTPDFAQSWQRAAAVYMPSLKPAQNGAHA